MKRMFAVLVAGAMLLLNSNAADAAEYKLYQHTASQPSANKVVANMQLIVTGEAPTLPVEASQQRLTPADSTRMITGGEYDTLTLNEGDVWFFEGTVYVKALRSTAEHAAILLSSRRESSLVIQAQGSVDLQSRNGLIQILGPGREYYTGGLTLQWESDGILGNVIIADHRKGLAVRNGLSGEQNGAQLSADQLFVLNNNHQLENVGIGGAGYPPPLDGHGARITLTNSAIWDSEPPVYGEFKEAIKLYLPLEFEATNTMFSDNVNIGTQQRSLADLRSMPVENRIVFLDCVFSDWFAHQLYGDELWPGFSDNSLGDDVFSFIKIRETRLILGGTHVVDIGPDAPPIALADITGNGKVELEDFKVLATSYGKPIEDIPFGRHLDLDRSGTPVDGGDMAVFAREFAGLPDDASEGEVASSEQVPMLARILVDEYRSVAEALVDHPVFGLVIQDVLHPTAVADITAGVPSEFSLGQNYPNPFNASTVIRFSLPVEAHTVLAVYNTAGQLVARLVDESLPSGSYIQQWDGLGADGRPVGTGLYLYRIRAGEYDRTGKMTLLR